MISILTNKYFIGFFIAFAILVSVILFGQKRYNDGFEARDLKAQIEMQALQNEMLEKTEAERNRQIEANKQAQELAKRKIEELEQDNQELEQKLKENEDAAKNDDNRDRIGLDPSSVLRLNRIK